MLLLLAVLGLLCLCSSYSNAQTASTTSGTTTDILILGDGWTGNLSQCTYGVDCWAGQTDNGDVHSGAGAGGVQGTFYFSGTEQTITNTIALSIALQAAGIQVDGYNYKWVYKNGNAHYYQQQGDPDDLEIVVNVYDDSGKLFKSYTYDYSGTFTGWVEDTGTETFNTPYLDPSMFGNVEVMVTGKDIAGWSGYYGPEFRWEESEITVNYSANPCYQNQLYDATCPGYAQALFDQQCAANALYDPTCKGYTAAYLNQQCTANPLYDASCSGYESAYLIQQCTADPLYDTSCEGYEAAQCDYDPLYSVTCTGYQQAYYEQQCSFDPQYDKGCNGYLAELDFDVDAENLDYDTTTSSPAYVVEGQPNVYETNNLPLFEPVYEQDSVQQEPEMLDLDSAMLELEDEIEAEIAQLESEAVEEEEIEDDIEAEIAALEETETEEVVLTPGGEEIVEDDIEAEIASLEESAEEQESPEKTSTISTKQDKMKELIAKKAVQTTKELEEAVTLEQTINIQRRLLALISYVPEFKQYYPKEVNQVAFYPPKPTVDHSYSRWFLNDPKYSQLENLQYSQQLK